tara:strand:- start:64 stop:921 length:858 start_codon:yes stop_codon:yes gene_type:complete
MILIADSGSTKCSWALCNEKGNIVLECNTIGFNPYFIDSSNILKHLKKSVLEEHKNKIDTVFFYGAGCSSEDKNKIIKEALTVFFDNAEIIVRHDIDAACYAMYKNNPNITCILGTGSNSCYFDGKHILENAPSLGFLVGDEASGNYFGKKMLKLYFNKSLSNDLMLKFESNYETNWPIIMENIYDNDRANVYLSKYFPFVSENKNHPIIKDIIYKGLNEFFDLHVLCYKDYKDTEINFIGSVAYYLSNEIHAVAKEHDCKIGDIIQNPIRKLISFHFDNMDNPK